MKTLHVSAMALLVATGCAHGGRAPAEPPSEAGMRAARHSHHAALRDREPAEPPVRERHARNDAPRMPPVRDRDGREHYAERDEPRMPPVHDRDGRAHYADSDARDTPRMPPVRDEARDERRVQHDERVEVPAHRERGHLASAGTTLPEGKKADRPTPAAEYGAAPDNTRVNERDREPGALTPLDQSESESDRELLQRIRKAVIADDALSFTAKNIKIITRDGEVTLRGAVNNDKEKTEIDKLARAAAGQKHVNNELEVSR